MKLSTMTFGCFGIFLAGASSPASSPASSENSPQKAVAKKAIIGGITVETQNVEVCVVTGEWSDGSVLHYQAWDSCENLTIKRETRKSVRGLPSLGVDARWSVSDIPVGAEIISIANEFSTVLIFPDADGITRDILVSD